MLPQTPPEFFWILVSNVTSTVSVLSTTFMRYALMFRGDCCAFMLFDRIPPRDVALRYMAIWQAGIRQQFAAWAELTGAQGSVQYRTLMALINAPCSTDMSVRRGLIEPAVAMGCGCALVLDGQTTQRQLWEQTLASTPLAQVGKAHFVARTAELVDAKSALDDRGRTLLEAVTCAEAGDFSHPIAQEAQALVLARDPRSINDFIRRTSQVGAWLPQFEIFFGSPPSGH